MSGGVVIQRTCATLSQSMDAPVMDKKRKSRIQEELLSLYLRLNGFFVTGFIVHSPIHGRNSTEIDTLAVRFPYNDEPERQVEPDTLLELSKKDIDLVICEVKSVGRKLQFNRALTSTPDAVASLLRWSGMFQESEVLDLVPLVQNALSPKNPAQEDIPTVVGPRKIRVRGFLCSPEATQRRSNQPWFISGPHMFAFISRCLCPAVPRSTCATTYDLGLWGAHETIVRYIKQGGAEEKNLDGLYAFAAKLSPEPSSQSESIKINS